MKQLLLLVTVLFLTACATVNQPSSVTEGGVTLGTHHLTKQQRLAQLAALRNWSAQGNIAAHTDIKGWNASYNWQQQDSNYQLVLFGPLGMGRTQIVGAPGTATLTTPGQQTYTANSPEALLLQRTGWSLPVSNLYYWLRGMPAPYTQARYKESFDMNNHVIGLTQSGWSLIYLRYISVNGVDLPQSILLRNPEWQVRMVITKWQIN